MSGKKKTQLAEIAEALLIFDKYDDTYPFLSAEHDIIYAGNPEVVSVEDKKDWMNWDGSYLMEMTSSVSLFK